MGKFIQFTFASCLGVFLAMIVLGVLFSMFIVGAISSAGDTQVSVKPNSILEVSFKNPVPERTNNLPVNGFEVEMDDIIGLHDIAAVIKKAANDDNIKGLHIDVSSMPVGRAGTVVLRDAVKEFKSTGKFTTAYANYYGQGTYHLASVADEVYLNPVGGFDFQGFASQVPFLKDMLDKIGVKMEVFWAGKFKSASEPFRRTDMSDEYRLQIREYINGLYDNYLQDISDSRGVQKTDLFQMANELLIQQPEDALKFKLVDALVYSDEVEDKHQERLGLDRKDKINMISIDDYYAAKGGRKKGSGKDKIAIVYAEGSIVDGQGENGSIGGEKYMKLMRKLRKDDKVKAIVLRVNSGGGSALASDMIWRETVLAKEAGKPFIVSMGSVAASGGYYIAAAADSIFVEKNTLTGSIGVFSMIPNATEMLNDKMGIKFDSVKTTKYAGGISPFFTMGEKEREVLKSSTERIYEIFLNRVADGRGMTRDEVHKVAQGRVWLGDVALKHGLVDRIAGLDDAIASAAKMAGLESYRVSEYPRVKNQFEQLLEEFTKTNAASAEIKKEIEAFFPQYKYMKMVKEMQGVPQARLPFVLQEF